MDGDGAHGYLYQVVGGALDLLLGIQGMQVVRMRTEWRSWFRNFPNSYHHPIDILCPGTTSVLQITAHILKNV